MCTAHAHGFPMCTVLIRSAASFPISVSMLITPHVTLSSDTTISAPLAPSSDMEASQRKQFQEKISSKSSFKRHQCTSSDHGIEY